MDFHEDKMLKTAVPLIGLISMAGLFVHYGVSETGTLYEEKNATLDTEIVKNNGSTSGLNLFVHPNSEMVYLADNEMDVRYSWNVSELDEPTAAPSVILEGGDIVVVNAHKSIYKFDRNGSVVWKDDELHWHNVADIDNEGNIISTYKKKRTEEGKTFLDQMIVTIKPENGEIIQEFSVYDALAQENVDILEEGLPGEVTEHFDPIHINKVEVLEETYAPDLEKGDIVFSARNIDTVGVIDSETKKTEWIHREDLQVQHYPDIAENGDIFIFNNRKPEAGNSEIVKLPAGNRSAMEEVVDEEDVSFYSRVMGAVQSLRKDRLLITPTRDARALEYDLESERVVWEVEFNSYGVYRVERYDTDCLQKVFNGEKRDSTTCRY